MASPQAQRSPKGAGGKGRPQKNVTMKECIGSGVNGKSGPVQGDGVESSCEKVGADDKPWRLRSKGTPPKLPICAGDGEDLGEAGDITAQATIDGSLEGAGLIIAREAGVLCGLPVVSLLAHELGLAWGWRALAGDGASVERGTEVARFSGRCGSCWRLSGRR